MNTVRRHRLSDLHATVGGLEYSWQRKYPPLSFTPINQTAWLAVVIAALYWTADSVVTGMGPAVKMSYNS